MEDKGFLNVEKIVDQLEIQPNMAVADFGAGHGFFSVAFAKKVGPSGQVFAIDILSEALEAIRSRAKLGGISSIKAIRGNLEAVGGSTLPDESCDLVFVANVFFQVPDKNALLGEARRVLKPGGRLAVIEWKLTAQLGPGKESRLNEEDLKQLILSKNFGEPKTIDAGSHHYGFIFNKIKL
jgi:ubiquinone/menaquinone biosynthesis C-methylase UbiE